MKTKILRIFLIVLVAAVLLSATFSGGFVAGHYFTTGTGQVGGLLTTPTAAPPENLGGTPQDLQALFKPFWEAWQILHKDYVDQPLDNTTLMRGAIRGMMSSLGDQHSSYMDPQEFSDANISLNGTYEGIGAWVDTTGDFLKVVSPMKSSPAEKAGLQPGDEIRMIDGKDMTGINPELARLKVIGPAGTTVHLSVARQGEEKLLEFDIVRQKITIPSVTGEIIHDNIAYVTITTFGDTTASDLHRVLTDLMAKNPTGLILDLRNNGGGYLETAIDVASEFIPDGVIMYEQYGDGTRQTYNAKPGGLATSIPMVVLVNAGSASASEIVAGALQVRGRAKLVGVVTYGKGSVQNWMPLSDNQGAIRVTIAKWLLPDGATIHQRGLTPNVVVQRTSDDIKAGKDPQLDAAVALLTAK